MMKSKEGDCNETFRLQQKGISGYWKPPKDRNFLVKVRIKRKPTMTVDLFSAAYSCVFFFLLFATTCVQCNRPPRFLIDGQTEIVLRLKEGAETPVGNLIYQLRGIDPDGDVLQFGVRTQPGSDVIRVESTSASEANVYLNKELDRETRDEYALVLTLTDGRLGQGNFITQSLLLLVEDVNDNTPVFLTHQPSVTVPEDAPPGVVATLEASDADEGAYGQVVYHLKELDGTDEPLFAVSTVGGKGIVRLVGSLDYERRTLHQLKILAVDRAKQGRVNTGTAALLVKVQDVEDQPPEFVRVLPVARVSEDAPIGTSILQVTAVDGDRGVNNKIAYSFEVEGDDEDYQNIFDIDKNTGVVTTSSFLDREELTASSGAYILKIKATEVGSVKLPPPSALTEVTIIVTDVNDETPTFRSAQYECEIMEGAPVNTPLIFLGNAIPEVYDHDQGNNGSFELQFVDDYGLFEITPSKGINEASFLIRVKNSSALDYEQMTMINFTLVAKETAEINPKISSVPIIVHVLDRNDNYPEFTKTFYEVSVPENCEVGSTVAWVQALDDDSGNYGTRGVRYTHLAGSIENLLYLHPVTGVITVKVAGGPSWDREQISRHYLTVEARDNLGAGNRNTVQLIVNIEDVNDNAPVFTQAKYEARLMENKLEFDVPCRVEARDADLNGTKNSEIEYSIVGGGEIQSNFSIDAKSGLIRPTSSIDFEKLLGTRNDNVRTILLTIRARDLGTPSLSTDVPLIVYVQDVNDYSPVFEHPFYNQSIPENAAGGTSILKVKAFDKDGSAPNNHVVYRIQSGASDKFVIGPESGIISVARGANLDPDLVQPKRSQYSMVVVALDGAPGETQLQAAVKVNISVMDVNNKVPIFVDPGTVFIQENAPVGTVVTRIEANDLDSTGVLRFKIDPQGCEARSERGVPLKSSDFNCLAMFSLNETDGVLRIARQLDREVVEFIQLILIVEDVASVTGPQISTTILKIHVDDVNDNNPKFRKPFYRYSVTENSKNGVSIGSVMADDLDRNRTITYFLEGPTLLAELVHLDSDTGEIVVANKVDHELYSWINLTVRAMDSGFPPRYSRVELFIQVLDENDNNPYFSTEPQAIVIEENLPVGTKIAQLQATDEDSGEFGKITYLLDRLSSQGKFSIDADSGALRVAENLDREERNVYLLVVEAWDNYQYGFSAGESRNAFKHINITVVDVNDNPPKLLMPPGCINITEFHEIGQPVHTISALDADDPDTANGQMVLEIIDGNKLELFAIDQINPYSAELKVINSLKGRHGNYSLIVRAQDMGVPFKATEATVQICVMDFNDHSPVFISPPHNTTLRIPENATVGSALVQIIATDEDVGPNGAVRYRLKADPAGHWRAFNLQPVSGVLELRFPLNREKQKIYDIRIEAYDLGVPTALSSDLDLTIYVSNINDYQPQFTVDEFPVNFTENHAPGEEVFRLPDTIDRDELEYDGPASPICYYIVGGNEHGYFRLHSLKHLLMTTTELDREKQGQHLLLVKASENCLSAPANMSFFDASDDTLLKVPIRVTDVNDNPPKFTHRVFTGGVSTATNFGTEFMTVKAADADEGKNAKISYYLIGRVQMTLTEGLDNLQRPPFIVDRDTGAVELNFDPQQGMKGYFDFMVLANDTGGLQDMARVFIYLLREDQRVRFVLRQNPPELRHKIESFREMLGNVTGAIVNIDEFRVHANHDGTIDKTRTDLYLHLVDRQDNSILEVADVLRLVDQNTEKLDNLFKEFNVLDTQPGGVLALGAVATNNPTFWLTASCLFLLLLLLLSLSLCLAQKHTYQRKLKAATTTAYDIDGRGLSGLSGRVPNTNKHSVEGSNPIWMQAYENEWYKHADQFSQGSDSLDENVVSSGEDNNTHCVNAQNDLNRTQNVYQTLPPPPPPRKLETTEL